MSSVIDSEKNKISQIAGEIRTVNSQLKEMENQVRLLENQIAQLPPVFDEDGNDMNEAYRSSLQQRQYELEAEIRSSLQQRNAAIGRASLLASSYMQKAEEEKNNAAKHAKTAQGMKAVSSRRFGKTAAAAAASASAERAGHYEKNAALYRKLAQAAERAKQGIDPGEIGEISEKGSVSMPGASGSGAVAGRSPGAGSGTSSWSSGNGGSPVHSPAAAATCAQLGIKGIPKDGGIPVYEAVAHAKESVTACLPGSAAAAAQADAAFAKEIGGPVSEAVSYRKENGLVWCTSQDGTKAYLVPQTMQGEIQGGCICPEPTPADKEAAYMQIHGYTAADYDKYALDPEYLVLHQQAHPDEQVAEKELPFGVKTGWVQQIVPGCSQWEASRIVKSMEEFSSPYTEKYKEIHRDENAQMPQTKDILRVFDSGNVAPYCGEIHRGISFSSREAVIKTLASHGNLWTEPGITSFSASIGVAEDFAQQQGYGLVLHCKNNRTGIPFRHISKCSWEQEILSPGQHRNKGWTIDYSTIREDPVKRIIYIDISESGG